jgi:hypothetical protein
VSHAKKPKGLNDPGRGSIRTPASQRTLARLKALCAKHGLPYREPASQWHAQRMIALLKARRLSSVSKGGAAPLSSVTPTRTESDRSDAAAAAAG